MTMIGSISHGTLRPQDLIPCFLATLDELVEASTFEPGADAPDRVERVGEAQTLMGELEARIPEDEDADYWTSEEARWDLEALHYRLNEFAPDGTTFGSHEGDGADFGFWPVEEEEW